MVDAPDIASQNLEREPVSLTPIVNLIVNGHNYTAMLDTGSSLTLKRRSTVQRLGHNVDKSNYLPSLTGITGQPLRVLGMTQVTVHVGSQKKYQHGCQLYLIRI